MTLIQLEDYTGSTKPRPEVEANARVLVTRVSDLLASLGFKTVTISSGIRSEARNQAVGGASKSTHLTGEGIDLYDPQRRLARAILGREKVLFQHDLYMEDPRWTPTHIHLQTRAPGSKKRIYIPNSTAPLTGEIKL